MNKLAWLIIGAIVLSACGPSAADIQNAIDQTQTAVIALTPPATATPDIPQSFLDSVDTFVADGARLMVLTDQGVTYANFKDQLATLKTSYGLAKIDWPNSFPSTFVNGFDDAMEGWDIALYLWELKIGDKDNPVEPNINNYALITKYAGDKLILDKYPTACSFDAYCGKQFLPFDENIGVLLAIAAEKFEASRKALDAALP